MIEPASEQETTLERYASKWTAQGYRLVKNPRGAELPAFLGSYRPDAILLGVPQNIVIEVVQKGQTEAAKKVEALKSILAGHSAWRLEVLYAGIQPQYLAPTSPNRLRDTLVHVEALDEGDPGAFLMLWAILEAAARVLEPDETKRPQSPGRVVELLAAAGYVAPSDADTLRQAATLRNRLIHGDLDVAPPPGMRSEMSRIANELVATVEERQLWAN